jgi:hypothetical protein
MLRILSFVPGQSQGAGGHAKVIDRYVAIASAALGWPECLF